MLDGESVNKAGRMGKLGHSEPLPFKDLARMSDGAPNSPECHTKPRDASKKSFASLRIADIALILAFNLLLFAPALQDATGFSYTDESLTVLFCLAALVKCVRKSRAEDAFLLPQERASLILLAAVVCIGLLGNASTHIQTSAVPILIDMFTCAKFVLMLISTLVVFEDDASLLRMAIVEAKLLIMVMAILAAVNLVTDIGMGIDPRYGLRASFMFVFPHPTYLCIAAVGLSLVFLLDAKANKWFIALSLLVVASSLRVKGLAFVAVALFLIVFLGSHRRLTLVHIICAMVLAVIIGWDQFVFHYQSGGFAREALTETGIAIANQHMPLGTGFATFGSAITAEPQYYSPLYYAYGLHSVHGLSPDSPSFLSDAFWPTVIGQFGWIGLACFTSCIVVLFRSTYSRSKGIAVLCGIAYLLISSTSESSFFNPSAVYLAFCIGMVAKNGSWGCRKTFRERP